MLRPTFVLGCSSGLPFRRAKLSTCGTRRIVPTASLSSTAIASKSYQLEEMEDAATSTSAIFLSPDGTLSFGCTDGPAPDRAQGRWEFSEENGEITLEIERWFGEEKFPFCVRRILRGHVDSKKSIGDLPLFEGAMFQEPTGFDLEDALGHFAMIEATDDLPNANFDISKSA